jgi:hypothetical protein
MWPSCSQVFAPLTTFVGLKKNNVIVWTPKMHQAFDKMCLLVAETLYMHIQTTTNGSTSTSICPTTKWVPALYKKAALLSITAKS